MRANQLKIMTYEFIERDEVKQAAEGLMAEALKTARSDFSERTDEALRNARTGDISHILENLQQEYDSMGMPGMKAVYSKTVADIETIRNKRIAAAREKVKKDLAQAEELGLKRLYEQSGKLYTEILKKIDEKELKTEVEQNRKKNDLRTAVKKEIIAMISAKNGVNIEKKKFIIKTKK